MNDAGVDFEEDNSFVRRPRQYIQKNDDQKSMVSFLEQRFSVTKKQAQVILVCIALLCFALSIIIPVLYFFF